MYVRAGWQCMLKFNDLRAGVSICGSEITLYNRHGQRHKYAPPEWLNAEVKQAAQQFGVAPQKWSYLDGGLLHHKHPLLRDVLVLWDVLVIDNEWLLGTTYATRYGRLLAACSDPFELTVQGKPYRLGRKLAPHVFVPELWPDFQSAWDFVQEVNQAAGWTSGEPVLEGVFFKNPKGLLQPALREENNTDWSARCRVRTRRHNF